MNYEDFITSKSQRTVKRKRGSVIFSPYYRVQIRNHLQAWQDIEGSFRSMAEADANFPAGQVCRIIEVTMNGRSVAS